MGATLAMIGLALAITIEGLATGISQLNLPTITFLVLLGGVLSSPVVSLVRAPFGALRYHFLMPDDLRTSVSLKQVSR